MLEVWAAPLSGGRFAVVLFNRSPGEDNITVYWTDIGADPNARLDVFDVWTNTSRSAYVSNYTAVVPARATVYLVLTPA